MRATCVAPAIIKTATAAYTAWCLSATYLHRHTTAMTDATTETARHIARHTLITVPHTFRLLTNASSMHIGVNDTPIVSLKYPKAADMAISTGKATENTYLFMPISPITPEAETATTHHCISRLRNPAAPE